MQDNVWSFFNCPAWNTTVSKREFWVQMPHIDTVSYYFMQSMDPHAYNNGNSVTPFGPIYLKGFSSSSIGLWF